MAVPIISQTGIPNCTFRNLPSNCGLTPRKFSPSWCQLQTIINRRVVNYFDTLGHCGLRILCDGVELWLNVLKSEAKVKYLKFCKYNNNIPLHLLSHIVKLENCFNKNYLKYYRLINVFNSFAQKMVTLDIKQAFWLLRTNKKRLDAFLTSVDKQWPLIKWYFRTVDV